MVDADFSYVDIDNSLLDIINNGPQPPRRVIFGTELVIREPYGAHLARPDSQEQTL
jgi:hypothetical protein